MDSHLVSLVRGEGGPFWPTRYERRLLKFALDRFGEMLTRFLLAGFGKDKVAPRWNFTVAFTGEDGTLQKRRLRVITHEPSDGSSRLPRGRDPLVLLALLWLLLHKRQRADDILVFQEEEMLRLLGWEDTDERRQEMDGAICRYSLLTYEWGMNSSELTSRDLAYYRASASPISQYLSHGNKMEEGGIKPFYKSVSFSELFIDSLVGRSLFDVTWDEVKPIKLTPGSRQRK